MATDAEITRDIVVAICGQIKEISPFDLSNQGSGPKLGKVIGEMYADVLKAVRTASANP